MAEGGGGSRSGFGATADSIGEAAETIDFDAATCGVTNRTVTLRTTEALEPPPIGRRSENSSAA